MKYVWKLIVFSVNLLIIPFNVFPGFEDTEYLEEGTAGSAIQEDDSSPFYLTSFCDQTGKSGFDKSKLKGQSIRYGISEVELGAIFYYNKCYEEGLSLSLGYSSTNLVWKHNPCINQTKFLNGTLALNGQTRRLCDWLWKARVAVTFDLKHFNPDLYTTYDLFLWGRYDYRCDLGLHVGFILLTGMKIDRVYPILGFDWKYNPQWKFNVIFPVNISAVYSLSKNWSLSVGSKFFDARHRVGPNNPLKRGIIEYRNKGAEVALNYNCNDRVTANIHFGGAFGGTLKVTNRHHNDSRNHHFNPSLYLGSGFNVSF